MRKHRDERLSFFLLYDNYCSMGIKRQSHAVYDTKYHLVWSPKYRKWILRGDIREEVKNIFTEILQNRDCEIEEMEIGEDHVHIFVSIPPKYSVGGIIRDLKCISAKEIFLKYPEVKKELWGGEFWEDGYFVRTVGDKVTSEIIKKYVQYHKHKEKTPEQMELNF